MYTEDDEHHYPLDADQEGVLIGPIIVCAVAGFIVAAIVCIAANAKEIDLFFTNLLTR